MTSDTGFDAAMTALTDGDPPRGWSLLVTVFGDLGQRHDTRFSGALLRDITAPIGVKPEALRVALHRLRKEGWITSHRIGRQSEHAVTEWGLAQIAAAAPRIYARTQSAEHAVLILTEPGQPDPPGVALRPGTSLGAAAMPGALCTDLPAPIPDWVKARCCPPDTRALCQRLLSRLKRTDHVLPDTAALSPLQRASLRVLIVHGWRRIALRLPALPDHCLPEAAQVPACRAVAMDLLDRLPVPALADLQAAA